MVCTTLIHGAHNNRENLTNKSHYSFDARKSNARQHWYLSLKELRATDTLAMVALYFSLSEFNCKANGKSVSVFFVCFVYVVLRFALCFYQEKQVTEKAKGDFLSLWKNLCKRDDSFSSMTCRRFNEHKKWNTN